MSVTLTQVLKLVGNLDDTSGEDTARQRFRRFLTENVREVGQARDFVEECLRSKGDMYNRALQDLVNHIGDLLGFEIKHGRYRGVLGEIGHDGLWKSPTGFQIVLEVKTTEAYAIKTATLLNYVNELISAGAISDRKQVLGLYVIGQPDPEVRQLENSVVAERMSDALRIISVQSLLSLAEMMKEYDVSHEDALTVLRPSGPTIDPIVSLMSRVVAGEEDAGQASPDSSPSQLAPQPLAPSSELPSGTPAYWLTPVASDDVESAEQVIQRLVGDRHLYAFSETAPGRRNLRAGDWLCFYASEKGVVAHGRIVSDPIREPQPVVRNSEEYPWIIRVDQVSLYLDSPVVIDAPLRGHLEAFKGREPNKAWGWFVVTTRKVSNPDFRVLTRQLNLPPT